MHNDDRIEFDCSTKTTSNSCQSCLSMWTCCCCCCCCSHNSYHDSSSCSRSFRLDDDASTMRTTVPDDMSLFHNGHDGNRTRLPVCCWFVSIWRLCTKNELAHSCYYYYSCRFGSFCSCCHDCAIVCDWCQTNEMWSCAGQVQWSIATWIDCGFDFDGPIWTF